MNVRAERYNRTIREDFVDYHEDLLFEDKTARVTVNLEDQACSVLQTIAGHEDVPVAQVARRAAMDYLSREEIRLRQLALLLIGSPARGPGGKS